MTETTSFDNAKPAKVNKPAYFRVRDPWTAWTLTLIWPVTHGLLNLRFGREQILAKNLRYCVRPDRYVTIWSIVERRRECRMLPVFAAAGYHGLSYHMRPIGPREPEQPAWRISDSTSSTAVSVELF